MRFERFKVIRDSHSQYNVAVPPWEAAVLTMVFDDGNVQPTGHFELVDRGYPDAGSEYDRLTRAYGADNQSGIPFVATVYGAGRIGIAALHRAIEAAKVEDATAKPVKRLSRADAEADPLVA